MATYRIVREIYDRNKLALALVMQNCQYGFCMTKKQFEKVTEEDLVKMIGNVNGDGCDYIYSITNLETGEETLFGEMESVEEDWDESLLEFEEEEN